LSRRYPEMRQKSVTTAILEACLTRRCSWLIETRVPPECGGNGAVVVRARCRAAILAAA
jgi:hypothetical protein